MALEHSKIITSGGFITTRIVSFRSKIIGLMLLITLSLALKGQEHSGNQATPAQDDIVTIKAIGNEKMDYERLKEIKGNIRNRVTDNFSFCLIDFQGTKVYSHNILPTDGKFDEKDEDFIILMPDKLPEAQYKLVIYADSKNNQRKEKEKIRFTISL